MVYKKMIQNLIKILEITISNEKISSEIKNISNKIKEIDKLGKLIVIFGNGGSAADSQHFAGELMCTYKNKNRKPFKALALTTDTSILTAWANDFSYDSVFERQVEAFNSQIGLAIGLSTSGESKNVISALNKANSLAIPTCLISGQKKKLIEYLDFNIEIPSKETEIIQTITQVVYHSICQELEK